MIVEEPLSNNDAAARWKLLRDRLVETLSRGFTVARLATETGLMAAQVEAWAADPTAFRTVRRFGEPSLAESIETALESRFAELDAECSNTRRMSPDRVETSVMRKAMEAFIMARDTPAMVDFTAPPGTGKTEAIAEYVAQCRKTEGYGCPVWTVELSEFNLSPKAVLALLVEQIGKSTPAGSEYELSRHVELHTEGKGGLLIVEEAQHLADTQNINGLRIINGLRRFVDRKLFGIVFVNNGEIYRRLQGGKHTQLFSRMESWRVEVKGVTEDDVDKVMAAWGVFGRAERDYCVKVAEGQGALRALVSVFRRAQRDFGVIDVDTMKAIRRSA